MPASLGHFAINADDVPRARQFYEDLFGWNFTPWGPPNFYQVKNAGVLGALQERRELLPGSRTIGFENTFTIPDLKEVMGKVEGLGGRMITRPYRIEGVGDLLYLQDTEGNVLAVMQQVGAAP
jgi:predicted enzyme related to lactoylglutathione lyase